MENSIFQFIDNSEKTQSWHRIAYELLIASRKALTRRKGEGLYLEEHHIIPKCFGGSDYSENLVLLTAREHFVAHLLLVKMFTGKKYHQMANAAMWLTTGKTITSRSYEMIRRGVAEAMSVRKPALGHKQSEDHVSKRSNKMIGNQNGLGHVKSEESKTSISKGQQKYHAELKANGELHPAHEALVRSTFAKHQIEPKSEWIKEYVELRNQKLRDKWLDDHGSMIARAYRVDLTSKKIKRQEDRANDPEFKARMVERSRKTAISKLKRRLIKEVGWYTMDHIEAMLGLKYNEKDKYVARLKLMEKACLQDKNLMIDLNSQQPNSQVSECQNSKNSRLSSRTMI